MQSKIKVLRVATISDAFIHIKGQLQSYRKENKEIVLVSGPGQSRTLLSDIGLRHIPFNIKREISPFNDLRSLFELYFIIQKEKPTIVHSTTPKAGLICALAAFLARVPVRIHTFTGQRWASLEGIKRELLISLDRLICLLNSQVYSDSPSQNSFLINSGVVKKDKIRCLHKGSLGGIDLERFNPHNLKDRDSILEKHKIEKDSKILLFLGRVTRDKGINELVSAFKESQKDFQFPTKLLIVGPYEAKLDPIELKTREEIQENPGIIEVGPTDRPEEYFGIADVLCLPSYREGFGTVVLEAAAMKVPTIGTKIPGLVDSILNEETGLLVEKKNINELKKALVKMINDKEKKQVFGENAFKRAKVDFSTDLITHLQWKEYLDLSN